MADGEKIYVGNGKEHTFPDGGKQYKIRLSLTNIKDIFLKWGWTSDAGKMYLNLILSERREKDSYGNTHYLTVDTWKPDGSKKTESKPAPAQNGNDGIPPDYPDDIPF